MFRRNRKISRLKVDSIDFMKEIPKYIEETEKTKKEEPATEKPRLEEKMNNRAIRDKILKEQIRSLKSSFDKFYSRTKIKNSGYFGNSFLSLVEKLNENIKKLKVEESFSIDFLQQYNKLKKAGKEAKKYIKQIDSIFEEARKRKNPNPASKSVSYKVGSVINLESVTGDVLDSRKTDLKSFIIKLWELKKHISNYHPIAKEKENLSLAKYCEHSWIKYVETCRIEKQQAQNRMASQLENSTVQDSEKQKSMDNGATLPASKLKNEGAVPLPADLTTKNNKKKKKSKEEKLRIKNNEKILRESIEKGTYEEKNDYNSAFDDLKMALQETINTEKFTKDDEDELNKFLESWDAKKKDLEQLKNTHYENMAFAATKGGVKTFFGVVKKARERLDTIRKWIP